MEKTQRVKIGLNAAQIILLSFVTVIMIGTLLLCAPFSSSSGNWTDFMTALFTATSATCVTGLTVVTTASYFSLAGQIIILCLIQVGGLGIMTIISVFSVLLSRSSSLRKRNIAMQATGAISYSEIKGLLGRIFLVTFIMEFIGALVLYLKFLSEYGASNGLKYAVFTAISAFCNAGFDVFGNDSLTRFSADPLVLFTISFLIIAGGIGYICWFDFSKYRFKYSRYSLHSKLALSAALTLLLFGTAVFTLTEYDAAFLDMPFPQKLMNAFFESVTLRTAGFYTVDQAKISDGGVLTAYLLMFIGGASGSTAGGLKTTTFAVLFFAFIANLKKNEHVVAFKRRIPTNITKAAFSILFAYVSILFVAVVTILLIESGNESADLENTVFECISAIATVGVTRGITAGLNTASKLIITLLMFAGRVGGFTFMLAFTAKSENNTTLRPKEDILIG